MKTAFLGLGTMGAPMARNLLAGGADLTVWNRSQAPVDSLREAGAQAADSPAAAVADADVVFSMLADDAICEQVTVESGALAAMKHGAIHVNMATVSVPFAKRMAALHAEHGVAYVAAPVMGRADVAAAAKLNILAAGDQQAIDTATPLLEKIGQKVWPVGDSAEMANVVKIQVNFMLAVAIESMGEACALGEVYGIDTGKFLDIVTNTLFACLGYQSYAGLIRESRYRPANMPATLGNKDVGLALSAANDRQVPLPLGGVVRDSLNEIIANGDGDKDWGALAEYAAKRARIDRSRERS
ncbi:NAD-binding 6-phosphogluconate dehydrogenase [Salinisphaera sp. T5B8]|uniref:NAD(P)-dependent oxidoreductase n=1 Tax=Salinisphaera sp. T5B8 TaxID=1304154 RepID=UPI00334031F7